MPAKPTDPEAVPAEKPHGHRERQRERFRNAGPDALADYELIEMILFNARSQGGRQGVKRFGSLAEVIHAPGEVDSIGDASIHQLKLTDGRIAKSEIRRSAALSSWSDVIDGCRSSVAFADNE